MTAQRLHISTAEYLADSAQTVSCSELGALFECDPRLTLRGLYLRKTRAQPERVAPGYVLAGRWYEAAVRQWYIDRHPGYAWDAQHADHTTTPLRKGNLTGHPDGIVTTAAGARWIAEAKLALMPGQWWREVPLWYQWQVHGYMALTGLPAAVVVQCTELEERNGVVIAINCREWLIETDRKVQAAILWEARRFIREHVRTGRPPAAVPRDLEALKREAPAMGHMVPLNSGDIAIVEAWLRAKNQQSLAEATARRLAKAVAQYETAILDRMGDADTAVLPGCSEVLRRKRQERKGHTVAPATTYRLVIEREK